MPNKPIDTLYAKPLTTVEPFTFNDSVADVFDNMISRSVPGYRLFLQTLQWLAADVMQDHDHAYDLGCSLGESTRHMRQGISAQGCHITAVDNAKAMVNRCMEQLAKYENATSTSVICADITDMDFKPSRLIALNFVLQFIAVEQRKSLINKLYSALQPGGVLFLAEKIQASDVNQQAALTRLHYRFKADQGYSELEIAQKRDALDDVLITETLESHQHRLSAVGFSSVYTVMQCFNFSALLAIK